MNFNVNVDDVSPGLALALLGIFVLLLLNKGFIDLLKGITGKKGFQYVKEQRYKIDLFRP